MIQLPLPMELATVPAPGSQGTKRSTTAAGYRWCLANNQQNPGAQNGSVNGLTNALGVWDKGLSYISSSMKRWVNLDISNHDPARSLKTWTLDMLDVSAPFSVSLFRHVHRESCLVTSFLGFHRVQTLLLWLPRMTDDLSCP